MILANVHNSLTVWGLAIAVLIAAAAASFVAGMLFERRSVERTFQKARQSVGRLFSMTNQQLKRAEAGCTAIERLQEINLSPNQRDQLADRQTKLGESLKRIMERTRQALPMKSPTPSSRTAVLQWVQEPVDVVVSLPDRSAFDANASLLLEACQSSNASGGMGLIRIDRLDRLTTRFGESSRAEIRQRVSELIASQLPQSSCQCVYADDTFAVLQPHVDATELTEIADRIRQSVRTHQFRLEESGVETLVTASFGFCACDGSESSAILRSRCTEALGRSEQRGRNQLHCHDGERTIECCPSAQTIAV